MSRVRSRRAYTRHYNGVLAITKPFEGGEASVIVGSRSAHMGEEIIADEIGMKTMDHPCQHEKREFRPRALDGCTSSDWNSVQVFGLPDFSESQYPALPVVSASDVDDALIGLLSLWTRSPPPVVNLAMFFAELKQTLSIKEQVVRLQRAYNLWEPWVRNRLGGSTWKTLGNKALRERIAAEYLQKAERVLKKGPPDVASAYLLWKFGVAPILQDVLGCPSVLASTIDRIQRYAVSNGKWKKHGIKRTLAQPVLAARPTACGFHEYFVHVTATKATIALSTYVKTDYKDLWRCLAELKGTETWGIAGTRALAQALGFSNIPLLVWELCPWSFVADWFTRAGGHISRWGVGLVDGTYVTSRPVTSIKKMAEFDYLYGNQVPSYTYGGVTRANAFYTVGNGVISSFTRQLSLPSPNPSPGSLTPGQQALLGALLTQLAFRA